MQQLQQQIIKQLNVKPFIDCQSEINERIDFLMKYLLKTEKKGFILGISGGQDSSLAGKLLQSAVEKLRRETKREYQFIAVRLPYGIQIDEDDAQQALEFIKPDRIISVNIKEAVDSSVRAFQKGTNESITDYLKGNIKARERMKVHYDLAGYYDLLVAGTDHAAEALTGFFTKYGDGGCDVVPLAGLNKRQGQKLLAFLGAPKRLYLKTPTADLLDNRPGRSDEEELGLKYEEIDDYLEGKKLPEEIVRKIERRYLQTEHKRRLPVTPTDTWWISK
ncbi:NAD(+) synthase [Pueribacillus theae]|uniref:NH(3)-dependent NAD(+) synthetase n=1 Tax=Pueribacillus theae TaxID=2171751 RepID=A0A2U1K797_9BACI|nr:ammonia-dependent NAD(+) synthetase [Pueribacillus theae]PWA13135.1 NAD(+) synthase [Pueribacillus theae]